MNDDELETYIILRYGSLRKAYRAWSVYECSTDEDDDLLGDYFSTHLSIPLEGDSTLLEDYFKHHYNEMKND